LVIKKEQTLQMSYYDTLIPKCEGQTMLKFAFNIGKLSRPPYLMA
jgi:hypothetical protein